ncbi:MAG: carbohydrate kinase family protein [Patescibacteria group bacterium]|jgi:ribokinase
MKYDFITVGGATRDISFFTDQGVLVDNKKDILRQELLAFEYGAKIKVDKFHYYYGGGAANSAVCLSRWGLKVASLLAVGDDEAGQLIKQNLKDQGVETKLIKTISAESSAASFILIAPGGERIIFGARGANNKLKIESSDYRALRNSHNIYLASLSGAWQRNLRQLFAALDLDKTKVFWNPGGTQIRGGLSRLAPYLKKTTVLALNKDEAIELVLSSPEHHQLTHQQLNRVDRLLKIIHRFGPQLVMITLGEQGVTVFDGQTIYRRGPVKDSRRIDTTGIGDIFNSTFSASYSQTGNIDKSLDLAMKNAAAKVRRLGAQKGLLKGNLKNRKKV